MIALSIPLMQWTLKKTLNKIANKNNNLYYAKLKGNQKKLLAKAIDISNTKEPTSTYTSKLKKEGKNLVQREVYIFTNDCCFYHQKMTHIKSIIKIDKTIHNTNKKTSEMTKKTTSSFAIANFEDDAKSFHNIQLNHWKVETMHFHKDKSLYEDLHTANINPMTMTILRSIVINILHLNKVKSIKNQLLENKWDLDSTLSLFLGISF